MPDAPAIPKEEYPQRLERLRAGLRAAGLDAVLLGTGFNLAYFTGYPSPERSVARPYFVLLPLRGDPVFIAHAARKFEACRFSWIADIREYTGLSRAPVELIRDALRDRGLNGKTIGMELGYEQALDISHIEFLRLQDALKGTTFADAAALLWKLRMIKSPHEVACLRHACRITTEASAATFAAAREGMPESAIYGTMRRCLDRPDTGEMFLVITSGTGHYDMVTKPPEARQVERGDMVWMDAGCTVRGYWSDFSRAGVVGAPSPEQEQAQDAIRRITRDAVRRIRPGVTAASIARVCMSATQNVDFAITSDIAALAGRYGHGIGLNLTEPPHLGLHDETVFEPGMVVSVEPGVATPYGTFHVEENVLVTEDGCEILSQAPRELWHIGASA